jgi:hypothetical protein
MLIETLGRGQSITGLDYPVYDDTVLPDAAETTSDIEQLSATTAPRIAGPSESSG